jgi:uncharacterized repeat protein (TIGR01451 family)
MRQRRASIAGALIMALAATQAQAAIRTVGVGGACPCQYATIAAAYAAANAGDTIELLSNDSEDVSLGRGIDIYFTSDTGTRVWDGAGDGNPTLTTTNDNNHIINISNLIMDHSGSAGGYVMAFPQHDVNLTVTGCILRRTNTSTTNDAIYAPGPDMTAGHFYQTKFQGNADSIGISEVGGNNDETILTNCTLSGFCGVATAAGCAIYTSNSNNCFGVSMMNCTLENNTYAYYDNYAGTNVNATAFITNSLFINNTTDLRLAPSEAAANTYGKFSYDAFSQQGFNAAFGAGMIYGVIPANEVINPCTGCGCSPDLHLLPHAQSIDKGTSTGAPAVDMDGVSRPQGAAIDIGAYEFGSCGPMYVPNSASNAWAASLPNCILINSPTVSPTPSPTGTPTRTPTNTPSPTASVTATPTPTPSVTPQMALTKTSNVMTATIGDTITFCINWENDSGATNTINVWDSVPSTLSYMSCSNACSQSGGVVSWSFSTGAHTSGTVCFWGTVNGYPWWPMWTQTVAILPPSKELQQLFLPSY